MKANIHPKLNNVVFVDAATKAEFLSKSTLTSEDTRSIDGEEYFVVPVQISSASHPHYTGKADQLVDTFDVVKKFTDKIASANQDLVVKKRKKVEARKSSAVKEVNTAQKLTLKDMMKQLQSK